MKWLAVMRIRINAASPQVRSDNEFNNVQKPVDRARSNRKRQQRTTDSERLNNAKE